MSGFEVGAAIAAAKGAFDVSKVALDLLKYPKLDSDSIRGKLLELQELILSAQRGLGDAEDEIRQLRAQLATSHDLKEIETDLEFVGDGHFYIRKSEQENLFVPYCPTCWGDQKKLIPLMRVHSEGQFRCPIHKQSHMTEAYLENERQREADRNKDRKTISGPDGWMGR